MQSAIHIIVDCARDADRSGPQRSRPEPAVPAPVRVSVTNKSQDSAELRQASESPTELAVARQRRRITALLSGEQGASGR